MKRQYKCILKTDVILNQKAATEGPNTTLDFIPGSNFLGVVASAVYDDASISNETKLALFHSGRVKFGDAHPALKGVRSERIPASVFYPKMDGLTGGDTYIYHAIKDKTSEPMRKLQLKQGRNGFCVFDGNQGTMVEPQNSFAIKSAHDRDKRTSADEQMYGYQSLSAGLELLFEVEADDEALLKIVDENIKGQKRIGRSRSAQYGLVEILETNYADVECCKKGGLVTVYADGRLIFVNEDGLPTAQPTIEQLGLKDGRILWEESQIRTFCYAPYNYKRRAFDTDRYGIEKGSVFVVETNTIVSGQAYVGSYNNEGFGAVIYNPVFLEADETGKTVVKIEKAANASQTKTTVVGAVEETAMLKLLKRQKRISDIERDIYPMTNAWVHKYASKFKDKDIPFASQWGEIRSIAMLNPDRQSMIDKINEYLGHGVAADKWKEKGRRNALDTFMYGLTDENAQVAMINLAAEVAKECRQDH